MAVVIHLQVAHCLQRMSDEGWHKVGPKGKVTKPRHASTERVSVLTLVYAAQIGLHESWTEDACA